MLDKRTKWCYTAGATGRDAAYAMVSLYLINYIQYTMKLTVAQFAAISAIMIVCLIWDAINDPLMGIIIENCHMKMGKFRPWILTGCLLNAVVIFLLFSVRPTGWAFVGFFGLSYLLWGMTYTMNDISYWGMLPSLSSDPKERNTLVTMMSIFICIGQFSVAGVVPMVIAGNAVNAYRMCALVVALSFIAFQLLTFFGAKEQPHSTDNSTEKLSLKDMFRIFARNDQLIAAGIAIFLFQIGSGLLIMFGMNFFYFEFGYSTGGSLVFIFTVMYGLGTLLSQVAFPFLTKKFSRKSLLLFFTIMITVFYVCFFLIGIVIPKIPLIINIIGFCIFFSQGVFNMVLIVMLNNTIEYDEYKFHERHDSIISAVRSFATKFASAVNQGITNLVLIISGIYGISQNVSNLEVAAGSGEITSQEVLAQADGFIQTATRGQLIGLRTGMTLIPILAIGIALLLLRAKYKIDEEEYDRMVASLSEPEN